MTAFEELENTRLKRIEQCIKLDTTNRKVGVNFFTDKLKYTNVSNASSVFKKFNEEDESCHLKLK